MKAPIQHEETQVQTQSSSKFKMLFPASEVNLCLSRWILQGMTWTDSSGEGTRVTQPADDTVWFALEQTYALPSWRGSVDAVFQAVTGLGRKGGKPDCSKIKFLVSGLGMSSFRVMFPRMCRWTISPAQMTRRQSGRWTSELHMGGLRCPWDGMDISPCLDLKKCPWDVDSMSLCCSYLPRTCPSQQRDGGIHLHGVSSGVTSVTLRPAVFWTSVSSSFYSRTNCLTSVCFVQKLVCAPENPPYALARSCAKQFSYVLLGFACAMQAQPCF